MMMLIFVFHGLFTTKGSSLTVDRRGNAAAVDQAGKQNKIQFSSASYKKDHKVILDVSSPPLKDNKKARRDY